MSDHKKLLQLLQQELAYQEKMLELLSYERAAIVKLNPEELEKITQKKDSLLEAARDLEIRRQAVFAELNQQQGKFKDVVKSCPQAPVRSSLEKIGVELKRTAQTVRDLNTANGQLLKQALGVVASTLSIFRSTGRPDTPTYGVKGKLKAGEESVFSSRKGVTREA